MDFTNVKPTLYANADEKYQRFSSALVPNSGTMLGVRIPVLQKLAKTLAAGEYETYFAHASDDTFEEIMLQGLVICFLKTDLDEIFERLRSYIPKITNWSQCDGVAQSLKCAKKHLPEFRAFLQPYLSSEREFEVRFAVVMLLSHFVNEEHLKDCFYVFDSVTHGGYYVKMAVAWAVQKCFWKFPEQTMDYLKKNNLDDETFHTALRKITESRATPPDIKKKIQAMKNR
ncbi:MAG: DNA alkylation repair protein [Oscillospiraceae bacterium]|jgi:3-methyladenine DNA glycosylase AlkD|nr:DNA alkylation repair protein [Oscillospiraceae bacterium]